MKKMPVLSFLLLYLFPNSLFAGNEISLNSGWEFTYQNKKYSAVVPGTIHTDLEKNKLIPELFYGDNETLNQWVANQSWHFEKIFDVDASILQNKNISLVFDGLDTDCKVYLNHHLILHADNMFRQWTVDVKNILREKGNEIEIEFSSQQKLADSLYKNSKLKLPGGERIMLRKAQYQFGWDFAPKYVTCGITKNVSLITWNDFYIHSAVANTLSLLNDSAQMQALLQIESDIDTNIEISCSYNLPESDQEKNFVQKIQLKQGMNEVKLPFSIHEPQLWWCNGMGKPQQYVFAFRLGKEEIKTTSGIRTIQLITTLSDSGSVFYFELNGKPVYAKGANYVPSGYFISDTARQKNIIDDAVNSNMNMLRVWGGGIYESDEFYAYCSKAGILIWQDFMYACAMYPFDESFLSNAKHEAEYQVKRLSKYPCMALWCGNNENSEGWQRWGWQNDFNESERKEIFSGYELLFGEILRNAVSKYSSLSYIESSPLYGRGDKRHTVSGDAHNWFVWHDGKPFENFIENVPHFMSEFGFQSLPSLGSLDAITDSIDFKNQKFRNHQKHNRGFEIINTYLEKYYWKPNNIEEYIYLSQCLQADGISLGIEAQRTNYGYCMGSLYWQFNDCWPAISWSSIEFSGEKKPLYYRAKKAYSSASIFFIPEKEMLQVYLLNEKQKSKGNLKIFELQNGLFDLVLDTMINVEINQPIKISSDKLRSDKIYIAQWRANDLIIAEKIYTSIYGNLLPLQKANVSLDVITDKIGIYNIIIESNVFVKGFFIKADAAGTFSDNYIDLLPGVIYTINFKSADINKDVNFTGQSLNDFKK